MSDFSVTCLDVGAVNYGDSILCVVGGKTILIDGGSPRSDRASQSVVAGEEVRHKPLQDQIRSILGQSGLAEVDLLIVTHCHSDHMGCIPKLFETGALRCKWALLADPQLGYGITADSDEPPPASEMSAHDKLWLALREEPLFNASDEQIAAFINDTANEYEAYVTFVNGRQDDLGSRCVVYRGPTELDSDGLTDLLDEFSGTGLHIYGPSFDLLLACAKRLEGRSEDLLPDAIGDSAESLVEAYRNAVALISSQDGEDSADGAAVNCQSLVLRLGTGDKKVLLTGDTQFARPDVGEGTALVKDLLRVVNQDAPFAMVKISHHGATNGQNETILRNWSKRFLLSTGSVSSLHPTEPTLKALERLEPAGIEWARVDMNGICTYSVRNGTARLSPERNSLNDATRPSARAGDAVVSVGRVGSTPPQPVSQPAPQIVTAPDDWVDIRIKLPQRRIKLAFTIEVDPALPPASFDKSTSREQPAPASERRPGGGQVRPRLLFVTDGGALAAKIGQPAADAMLASIRGSSDRLLDDAGHRLIERTQSVLREDASLKGVVLLGGYEVVPSQIVDTLPRQLAGRRIKDRDRLQVWSDDGYGDRDGDKVPEVPVSRVPDSGDADFMNKVLSSPSAAGVRERSGIRNIRRPFADAVFAPVPGRAPLFTSSPTAPNLPPYRLGGDVLYLMLHGDAADTTTFTGEDPNDFGAAAGLGISEIPKPCPAIVLAGCCYGALIVDTPARDATPGGPLTSKRVEESVALSCLNRGANAFVGCTAVHYSPTHPPPLKYFGEPMHRAFIKHVLAGRQAAEALWQAKVEYSKGIPHRPGARVEEIAYEHKILRQFTCLGLGW